MYKWVKRRKVLWHWAQPGKFSGCPRVEAGDWSTDAYPKKVTCPRCVKLKTRLKALRNPPRRREKPEYGA